VTIKVSLRSNEKIDKALRRFKRKCEKEDLFKDVYRVSYFEKPVDKRRRDQRKIQKEKQKRLLEQDEQRHHGVL